MTKQKKQHQITTSYSFNRTKAPLSDSATDKVKPPTNPGEVKTGSDSSRVEKKKKELSLDEQAQQHMDAYRKAERILIINYYTGGGTYKRGILDAIYRGFNPLNP